MTTEPSATRQRPPLKEGNVNIRFAYADKAAKSTWLPAIFALLYANMSVIAPTGCTFEEDFAEWVSHVSPALDKAPRQIVLMYDGDRLIGYFQYYVNGPLFMMEEIQLERTYHGSGVFQTFYRWLLPRLPADIQWVEAYAHKQNAKSRGILAHLGLCPVGEGTGGRTDRFRGDFGVLKGKFFPTETNGKR